LRPPAPLLFLLLATACFERAQDVPAVAGCADCHGGAANAAPPSGLGGIDDGPAVGAHQAHLTGARLGRAVACGECHLVPGTVDAPGHIDTPWPAEVQFGALASTGAAPTYDRATAACNNTYCHGAGAPAWTDLDGSEAACGACHAMPPPPPHPASNTCEACHAPVAGPNQTLADPSRHLDGTLDVDGGGGSCATGCHGDDSDPAPPLDLNGASDTSTVGVGAHRIHLAPAGPFAPVTCTACHVDIQAVGDPGHTDTAPPAEVVWGAVPTTGGRTPAWDRDAATCANTHCHGSTTPVWTNVDGTQAACGTCHANPPPPPHPGSSACNNCHGAVAGPNLTITAPNRHVDGTVDFN
jgi:predicted CxxxxCH...CXXCH cytochrome family protein